MTRHEIFENPAIAEKDLVLATDLDGTFLGGHEDDRRRFYGWIEAHRNRIGLIFVTGRDPGFISQLTSDCGVPKPDYVVGDVGTTIALVDDDHSLSPIFALEKEISDAWSNAGDRVRAALDGVRGLTLQPTTFRYRVSYDLDPEQFDDRALEIVEELGFDAIVSDNRFFDVLPRGVSKGPSLLRLLAHLGIDHERTLVAGDTLNDLSMLKTGLPAVAVGGSEPGLIAEVVELDQVHVADGIGVLGIAEAISEKQMFAAS